MDKKYVFLKGTWTYPVLVDDINDNTKFAFIGSGVDEGHPADLNKTSVYLKNTYIKYCKG